jgi:hypothetical protein
MLIMAMKRVAGATLTEAVAEALMVETLAGHATLTETTAAEIMGDKRVGGATLVEIGG